MEIRIYAFILNTQISSFSNLGIQIIEQQNILSYCLSLNFGEQRNFYIGGTATGVPDVSCKYSYGNCRKLNNTFAQISIYPRNSDGIIYTNTYNGTEWDGWRKGVSDADLFDLRNIKLYSYTDYDGLDDPINRPLFFARYGKLGVINFFITYTKEYTLILPEGTGFPFVQTLIAPSFNAGAAPTSTLNIYVQSNFMKFTNGKVGDKYFVNFVFLLK